MIPILIFSLLTFTVIYLYLVRTRVAMQARMDVLSMRRAELIAN